MFGFCFPLSNDFPSLSGLDTLSGCISLCGTRGGSGNTRLKSYGFSLKTKGSHSLKYIASVLREDADWACWCQRVWFAWVSNVSLCKYPSMTTWKCRFPQALLTFSVCITQLSRAGINKLWFWKIIIKEINRNVENWRRMLTGKKKKCTRDEIIKILE